MLSKRIRNLWGLGQEKAHCSLPSWDRVKALNNVIYNVLPSDDGMLERSVVVEVVQADTSSMHPEEIKIT